MDIIDYLKDVDKSIYELELVFKKMEEVCQINQRYQRGKACTYKVRGADSRGVKRETKKSGEGILMRKKKERKNKKKHF